MDKFKIVFHINHEGKLPEVMEILEFERPRGMSYYEFKNYVVRHLIDNVCTFGIEAKDQTAFVFRNSKLAFSVDCKTVEDAGRIDSNLSIIRTDGHRHFYRLINIAC